MHDNNLLEDQPIAWTPTPDIIDRAQLTKFMRQVGVSTWDELYEFSIRDVERFTEEVLTFLDIKFDPPYEKLLDTSSGVEFPNWFGRNADTPVRHRSRETPFRQPDADDIGSFAERADKIVRVPEGRWHYRGYLPHFDGQVGQFITFRLHDSLPKKVLVRLKIELAREKLANDSREYRKRVEEYLDEGIGECILQIPRVAEIVASTLMHEHGQTCDVISWVIMPNHAHILLKAYDGSSLSDIMKRIKGVSARRINEALDRKGKVWQSDYFDRHIRDAKHFSNALRYIENNPVKAGLCRAPEDWYYSSAHRNADTRNADPRNADTPVRFLNPEESLLNVSDDPQGPSSPQDADRSVRVPTAGLNITTMCLDRWQTDEMKDQPAVIWEDEQGDNAKMTYAELLHSVESCAASLRKNGLNAGDAIGIHLPMMIETVIALLAIGRIGAIATPVFSGYGVEAIASRMTAVNAKAIFTGLGFLRRGKAFDSFEIATEAIALCPSIARVFVAEPGGQQFEDLYNLHQPDYEKFGERIIEFEALIAQSEMYADRTSRNQRLRRPEPTSAEDPLIILYTSGTTGKPKGIAHTHASFPIKAAQDMAFGTDVGKGTRISWYTDIGWMMGPWLIYGALINGATICIYDGAPDFPTPDRMWEFVAKHKVEILGISPTLIRALAAHEDRNADTPVRMDAASAFTKSEKNERGSSDTPVRMSDSVSTQGLTTEPFFAGGTGDADKSVRVPFERHDLSSLRAFASTGEPWNPAPWWWLFEKVGNSRLPIINYSGGTEIAGGILMGNMLLPQKPCSFPAPCPGMDVDILDETGHPVEPGKVGELVIKQPWIGMARGFWQEKERYLDTYWRRFKDIWVHGDFAMRDKDGHWFILGRSDDTLKVAGKRVGPAEVESLLIAHPQVIEAAVIGVPDEKKGTAMVAFCVLSRDHSPQRRRDAEMQGSSPPYEGGVDAASAYGVVLSLETELKALVSKDMGKPLAPSRIHFVSALPKTRNAKVMRRVIRSAYLGEDPGDLSALENPQAVEEITELSG